MENSFAHQFPQLTEETQKTSASTGSIIVLSEDTAQTGVASDEVESVAESMSHKSAKDDKNREHSSQDDHNKENVHMIKKMPSNKNGTTAIKKLSLSKKKANTGAKSRVKPGIHAQDMHAFTQF